MDPRYAVALEPDEGAFQVIVPAFPEIHTFGETVEDALAMARDAIELSLAVRRD
jgi:predicted RNase H-like HicB family nuclease